MFDSSHIERRMKRQDSVSYYTAAGEQSEKELNAALASDEALPASAAPRAFLSAESEEEFETVYPPPQWCSVRKLSIAGEMGETSRGAPGATSADKARDGWTEIILVKLKYTVGEVKRLVERHDRVRAADQRLQHGDAFLDDDAATLRDCGVQEGDRISVLQDDADMRLNLAERSVQVRKDELRRQMAEERLAAADATNAAEVRRREDPSLDAGVGDEDDVFVVSAVGDLGFGSDPAPAEPAPRPQPRARRRRGGPRRRVGQAERNVQAYSVKESNTDAVRRHKAIVLAAEKVATDEAFKTDFQKSERRARGRNHRRSKGIRRQKSSSYGFQRTFSSDDFFNTLEAAQSSMMQAQGGRERINRSVLRALGLLSTAFFESAQSRRGGAPPAAAASTGPRASVRMSTLEIVAEEEPPEDE
jgi:hypothetical protein